MPKTILARKQATPTGSIQPLAGATAPDGFLVCDGSIVTIANYPKLYAAIGTSWGYGSNDGLTFHLPDLRGRVLRGQDQGAGRDPNAGSRAAANAGGNTGDAVGSVQGEATKKNGLSASTSGSTGNQSVNHTHNVLTVSAGSGSTIVPTTSNALAGGNGAQWQSGFTQFNDASHTHAISVSTTINQGDAETRMINANVNYIIKAI